MRADELMAGVVRYQAAGHSALAARFEALAGGQSPGTMLVTCSDSRIVPSLVTDSGPGDVFVVRNAGNIVPPFGAGGGEGASLEFAVTALGVRDVVVCGHAACGAMRALLDPSSVAGSCCLAGWLDPLGDLADGLVNDGPSLDAIVRRNVVRQLEHLRTYPFVQEAEADGRLSLHGWVYDFVTGQLDVVVPAGS